MKVQPYTTVGEVAFGADAGGVVAILGKPQRKTTDRLGRTELHYPELVVRLSGAEVVEISVDARVVEFPEVAVPFHNLAQFLRQQDTTTFDAAGFVVSPGYGVAMDPHFPAWVTVFCRGELVAWRKHAA
jgi:hypothetical protein